MITTIPIQKALSLPKAIFIDTRTPAEFEEDHLPEAVNIPLLSNEERAVVGTLYKQVSQEKAIEKGREFFAAKLPEFMASVKKYKNCPVVVYCWRGGMRSKTVASLLDSLGYNVFQLVGGYKEYRCYVRETLDAFTLKPRLVVLWGLTCSGKTALLQKFPNALDLEGLAQHRGSLYGSIGLRPRSQKQFENLLLQRLNTLNPKSYVFVEGESRKIGNIQIPLFLYTAMRNGVHVLVQRSMERRAEEAVKEYFKSTENVQTIITITKSLQKVISFKKKQQTVSLLEQGNYVEAMKLLLEFYYDPLYAHTLTKMQYAFEINNDEVHKAVRELQEKISHLPEIAASSRRMY